MSRNAGIDVRLIIIAGFLMISRAAVSGDDPLWRPTDPQEIVYMELDDGLVIVELNPGFAPETGFIDGVPVGRQKHPGLVSCHA